MSVVPVAFGGSQSPIQVLEEVKKVYGDIRFVLCAWVNEDGEVMYAYSDSGLPERNLMVDAVKAAMMCEGTDEDEDE